MNINKKIINNFTIYDNFLTKLNQKDKNILISLKMMYSIHMENQKVNKNILFISKQTIRFVIKLVLIPFYVNKAVTTKNNTSSVVLKNCEIENYISNRLDISILEIKKSVKLNFRVLSIYKKLFRTIYIIFKNKTLNKKYIILLMHRLIDYLMVYETLNIEEIKCVLIENDRIPQNLALIHLMKRNNKPTIKYDNWLIDPINHNDIYCEYYYYPSVYHKKIISSFEHNRDLKYIEGGFLHWDELGLYQDNTNQEEKLIIYFTQFGVPIKEHLIYLNDIVDTANNCFNEYKLIVKIHPRENIKDYQNLKINCKNIEIIELSSDIFALISTSDFCFSIFSTISLEAKHIIDNSFFINYDAKNFNIIDYDEVYMDLIKSKEELCEIFSNNQSAISKDEFIKNNNCMYPNTITNLKRILNGINNNSII